MYRNYRTKLTAILLASMSLLACNGGNNSSNTSSATTANPLRQYINLLTYTPAQGKQLSTDVSNQQSFSTPGGIQINSVDIKYYSGENCSGTATLTTTLNGPSTPAAGTYTSSNASNYALCEKYASGCEGLFNAVTIIPPLVRSMQYTYNLNNGVFTTQCLSNANNNPFDTGAFETILDYSDSQFPVPCISGSSCGYSQSYAATPLFTQIALPQTGQLYCVPGTSFTKTCGSGYTSVAGTDGYGRNINIPSYGNYIPYGVAWAYNGIGALNPRARFTAGKQANGTADCPSGQEVRNDNLTGLMWVKDLNTVAINGAAAGSVTPWANALDSVTAMNASGYCGYTDWRLPNVNELASLVNQGAASQAAWLNGQGFSNVQASFYWSSTTYALNTASAWRVFMNVDSVSSDDKIGGSYYVWPVRGNSATSMAPAQIAQTGQTTSYAAGDDGALQTGTAGTNASGRFMMGSGTDADCITDSQTGLMWPKNGIIGFSNGSSPYTPLATPVLTNTTAANNFVVWNNVFSAINNLNTATLCGYSDWRLPNRNELRSLANYGKSSTATWLNSQGFSNVQMNPYWSSTTNASITTSAWRVFMNVGSVSSNDKTGYYFVLPVRGGQ